ncbi:hypothetical protein [Nonomuraea sp. NPDC049141]
MSSEQKIHQAPDLLEQIKQELESIDGMADFVSAARGFIRGDLELDEAAAVMMRFLHGDGYGGADERKRIVELAQAVEAQCGFVAITVSVSACTAGFSCSLACC